MATKSSTKPMSREQCKIKYKNQWVRFWTTYHASHPYLSTKEAMRRAAIIYRQILERFDIPSVPIDIESDREFLQHQMNKIVTKSVRTVGAEIEIPTLFAYDSPTNKDGSFLKVTTVGGTRVSIDEDAVYLKRYVEVDLYDSNALKKWSEHVDILNWGIIGKIAGYYSSVLSKVFMQRLKEQKNPPCVKKESCEEREHEWWYLIEEKSKTRNKSDLFNFYSHIPFENHRQNFHMTVGIHLDKLIDFHITGLNLQKMNIDARSDKESETDRFGELIDMWIKVHKDFKENLKTTLKKQFPGVQFTGVQLAHIAAIKTITRMAGRYIASIKVNANKGGKDESYFDASSRLIEKRERNDKNKRREVKRNPKSFVQLNKMSTYNAGHIWLRNDVTEIIQLLSNEEQAALSKVSAFELSTTDVKRMNVSTATAKLFEEKVSENKATYIRHSDTFNAEKIRNNRILVYLEIRGFGIEPEFAPLVRRMFKMQRLERFSIPLPPRMDDEDM